MIVSIVGILLLPFWLLGLGQWLSKLYFHTLECELTERNLRFSKGVLVHVEKTIPLENIQDLSFIGGPILRAFSLVIIRVETAGGGGPHQSNAMSILGIDDAENMKSAILEQREIAVRNKFAQQTAGNSSNSNDPMLARIHEELVAIKEVLKQKD